MEFDFVYADLQTTLTVKADNEGHIGKLTDIELKFLGNLLYMTLNTFITGQMAKYFSEIDKDKIRAEDIKKEQDDV